MADLHPPVLRVHRTFRSLIAMMLPLAFGARSDAAAPGGAADPFARLAPHPRLLATPADFARLRWDSNEDPLRTRVRQHLLAEAEFCLGEPLVEHTLVGPRLLPQSRAALRRITTCALAYHATGDARFRDRAVRELLAAASLPDWNPNHFLDVAEMATAVALGYDWLHAELMPGDRSKVRRALVDKALRFAPEAYASDTPTDLRWWWVPRANNWNQVCNGGFLAAALAVADEEPELARTTLAGVRRSLPRMFEAYAPDGGYPEGPGYWEYGTAYHVLALAMLDTALGDRLGLDGHEGFRRTATYRLAIQGPTGANFNYADGVPEASLTGNTAAYAWMAAHFGPPAALANVREIVAQRFEQLTAEELRRGQLAALLVLWLPRADAAQAAEPAPLDFHFRGPADIALFRSAWHDPRAIFVGFKAGSNAVNHGHVDLGSFILDADGVRWALDLGSDDYNLPGYFTYRPDARWSYFRLVNLSHNTLTLDGARQDTSAVAPIVDFESTPGRASATADLSAVHPGFDGRHLRRISLLDRARVLVEDNLHGAATGVRARWVMVTPAEITFEDGGKTALLRQQGRTLRATLLAPEGAVLTEASARPPKPEENQNEGTRMLAIDWALTSGETKIAVLLTPEPAHGSAPQPAPELSPIQPNPRTRDVR